MLRVVTAHVGQAKKEKSKTKKSGQARLARLMRPHHARPDSAFLRDGLLSKDDGADR